MRLSIDHRTRYSFSQPQARVVQLLRMTPQDDGAQSVINWSIDVDCDARLSKGRDGYGNITTMLYVDGPVDHVEIMVRGEVATDAHAGLVTGTLETLPPVLFQRQTAGKLECVDQCAHQRGLHGDGRSKTGQQQRQ